MAAGNRGKPVSLNTCSVQDTGSRSEEVRVVNNDTCSSLQGIPAVSRKDRGGPLEGREWAVATALWLPFWSSSAGGARCQPEPCLKVCRHLFHLFTSQKVVLCYS